MVTQVRCLLNKIIEERAYWEGSNTTKLPALTKRLLNFPFIFGPVFPTNLLAPKHAQSHLSDWLYWLGAL